MSKKSSPAPAPISEPKAEPKAITEPFYRVVRTSMHGYQLEKVDVDTSKTPIEKIGLADIKQITMSNLEKLVCGE